MRRRRSLTHTHPWAAGALAAGILVLPLTAPTTPEAAAAPASPTAAPTAASATVFYYTKTKNWTDHHLHYAPDGGSWT
ncbi:carbohydrate binding domain-containing protein, partial [Streptomyces sp. Sce081]